MQRFRQQPSQLIESCKMRCPELEPFLSLMNTSRVFLKHQRQFSLPLFRRFVNIEANVIDFREHFVRRRQNEQTCIKKNPNVLFLNVAAFDENTFAKYQRRIRVKERAFFFQKQSL